LTQNARSASRRAQFQLWIFSYTNLAAPSKKRLSRVMSIDQRVGRAKHAPRKRGTTAGSTTAPGRPGERAAVVEQLVA
jgi:hypothetical protein